jgi:signal transduction histidine kinase
MGGEINVESEFNKGSKFYFNIPLTSYIETEESKEKN